MPRVAMLLIMHHGWGDKEDETAVAALAADVAESSFIHTRPSDLASLRCI